MSLGVDTLIVLVALYFAHTFFLFRNVRETSDRDGEGNGRGTLVGWDRPSSFRSVSRT